MGFRAKRNKKKAASELKRAHKLAKELESIDPLSSYRSRFKKSLRHIRKTDLK